MDLAERWLKEKGVKVYREINQGLPMLVALLPGKGRFRNPRIMFNGHVDVVPGKPEQFEPHENDGKLFGRGAYDMLAALAVMMSCIGKRAGDPPECGLGLMLVPSEETAGEIGTQYLLKKGYGCEFAICGEPTNLGIGIEAKGILQIEIDVQGKACHGSRPWEGANAIEKAMAVYSSINKLPFTRERTESYPGPSTNLARISSGDALNRVPDRCTFALDIRYLPNQRSEAILEQIKSVTQGAAVRIVNLGMPVSVSKDDPHVRRLGECIAQVCRCAPNFISQHGSADTRFFAEAGIPAVEFGPVGANHHGDHEYVEIRSLWTFERILEQFIKREDSI
jgi:succinyl-diaminopimelate desuccinylase